MRKINNFLKIRATTIGGESLIEAGNVKIQVDKWLKEHGFKFVEFEYFRKGIIQLLIKDLREVKRLKLNLTSLKNSIEEKVLKISLRFLQI